MVFVGDRRAKERKNTIAHGLGDVAFIAMHGDHHELQGRVNNGARVFRVEVLDEFHRTFDIGEQGGNGFPLALSRPTSFKRGLLSADTLGQMGRGVGVGAGGWGLGVGRLGERRSALHTELGSGDVLTAAVRTAILECASAFDTKLCAVRIVGVTLETLHGLSYRR